MVCDCSVADGMDYDKGNKLNEMENHDRLTCIHYELIIILSCCNAIHIHNTSERKM